MKKLLLALALLWTVPAFGQQCPTRPPGDNTNACASTAFVVANSASQVLTQNFIIVGSAGNVAVGVPMSNDCSIISSGAITCTKTNGVAFATLATKVAPVCADLTNSAASCSTNTTNATNITSGTLPAAQLPAFGSADVSCAAAGGACTIAANAVTNAKLATMTQNAVKGAATSTAVADLAVPSCSAATSALIWTTNTGFGCNTISSGALTPLNTLTASNSATLSDTTSLTSTYKYYDVVFENIVPVTNLVTFQLQVHSGGTFQSGAGAYTFTSGALRGVYAGSTGTGTSISLNESASLINTDLGLSGTIRFFNPSQTTSHKWISGYTSYLEGATAPATQIISGFWNGGNGAIDGFQVLMSSGNISSGTVKIYGGLQ
jgi:hypothetical protein